jgi:hypothetical protein
VLVSPGNQAFAFRLPGQEKKRTLVMSVLEYINRASYLVPAVISSFYLIWIFFSGYGRTLKEIADQLHNHYITYWYQASLHRKMFCLSF